MRAEDILDAIGEIDDDIIKSAKEKRKPNRAIIYALSGVAACFILMFLFPIVFISFKGAESEDTRQHGWNDNSEAIHFEYVYSTVEVVGSDDTKMYSDYNTVKSIVEMIMNFTGDTVPESSIADKADDTTVSNESLDTKPETEESEYMIRLIHQEGNVLQYRLSGNILTNLSTGKIFILTEAELGDLMTMIWGD
ncbi:MAG: hypothetical protein E7672_00310 [Ruminococcaceae bacterium]|nr:hypothetical protein [Oscillospiraceae bacterium]